MRIVLAALAALLIVAGPAHAEAPSDERLKKMFDVTGVSRIASTIIDQMRPVMIQRVGPALRQAAVQQNLVVPDNFDEIVAEEFDRAFSGIGGVLIAELTPLYQQAFSADEIEQVIAFYDTDLGRRLVEATEQITPVAGAVGQVIGAEKGREMARNIMLRLEKADGVEN
jgi:hypothetical protein